MRRPWDRLPACRFHRTITGWKPMELQCRWTLSCYHERDKSCECELLGKRFWAETRHGCDSRPRPAHGPSWPASGGRFWCCWRSNGVRSTFLRTSPHLLARAVARRLDLDYVRHRPSQPDGCEGLVNRRDKLSEVSKSQEPFDVESDRSVTNAALRWSESP